MNKATIQCTISIKKSINRSDADTISDHAPFQKIFLTVLKVPFKYFSLSTFSVIVCMPFDMSVRKL